MTNPHRQLPILALAVALALAGGPARAALILDGAALPGDQGWSLFTNIQGAPNVTTDGTAVVLQTVGAVSGSTVDGPLLLYYLDWPFDPGNGFRLEVSLRVDAAAYNPLDAGVAVFPIYTGPEGGFAGSETDRRNLLAFTTNSVGWGDNSAFALDTTDGFHTYELTVTAQRSATLLVDGQVALRRSGYDVSMDRLAFGDSSNDVGIDGTFAIQSIRLSPTPEPTSALLLGFGLVSGAALRRRSTLRR